MINTMERDLGPLTDADLRKRSLSLRYRAQAGEQLSRLLVEAYALVREAARRTIHLRHFDVQVLGGIAMFRRSMVEMETGEGKTLAATLPLYLYGLTGKGCHLVTANDYLAKRDAQWMGPVYRALGLSAGVIQADTPPSLRRQAYACDVTYGTVREFAFDFLRDRLLSRAATEGRKEFLGRPPGPSSHADASPLQRPPYFALVDEADSILIDEARTPLFISAPATATERLAVDCYLWSARACREFREDVDYYYDHDTKRIELTRTGRQKARQLSVSTTMENVKAIDIYEYLERAIKVERDFRRDREYVVCHGKIAIIDEHTGRGANGRIWSGGIHQAVEAKEGLEVTVRAGRTAQITVQDFFLRYPHLAGTTGTALAAARELRKIYGCSVLRIPTNRPSRREELPPLVFGIADAKWAAVVEEVRQMHARGRPVLIGTRSIDKSEHLSRLLTQHGIEHQVLNAYHVAEEAEIVAQAGLPGRVTVSTNMAGRGTDIQLGDGVAEIGGLHVIGTEMHDSCRIDRQLFGRCGRQGDPGTYRQYLALDDELLLDGLGPEKSHGYREMGRHFGDRPVRGCGRTFRKAQKRVEAGHFRDRRALQYYEKRRRRTQRQMGQDPYLDTPAD